MKKAAKPILDPAGTQNSTVQASKMNRKKILNNQQVLSDSQKDEIKKAFDFFDITGSGFYNSYYFHQFIEFLGTIEARNLKVS